MTPALLPILRQLEIFLDVIENSTMHAAGTPIGMSLAAVFQVFYCNVGSPVHKLEHVYI